MKAEFKFSIVRQAWIKISKDPKLFYICYLWLWFVWTSCVCVATEKEEDPVGLHKATTSSDITSCHFVSLWRRTQFRKSRSGDILLVILPPPWISSVFLLVCLLILRLAVAVGSLIHSLSACHFSGSWITLSLSLPSTSSWDPGTSPTSSSTRLLTDWKTDMRPHSGTNHPPGEQFCQKKQSQN